MHCQRRDYGRERHQGHLLRHDFSGVHNPWGGPAPPRHAANKTLPDPIQLSVVAVCISSRLVPRQLFQRQDAWNRPNWSTGGHLCGVRTTVVSSKETLNKCSFSTTSIDKVAPDEISKSTEDTGDDDGIRAVYEA